MCLGIPVKLTYIDTANNIGKADFGGVEREVRLELLSDVKVGDWVIMHAGFGLSKLDEKEAMETLKLIEEVI